MATLSGQTIANTFDSLLHVEDDTAGLVATSTDSRVIQDGVGANSALALATDSVRITSTNKLYFNDVGDEHISSDGTDLTIAAGTALNITADVIDLSDATKDVTLNAAVDALNFDSNTLSIDASNNRIGFGTAAPSSSFHVTSSTADQPQILVENTANDNTCSILYFRNTHAGNAGVDGDELGKIFFQGMNDGTATNTSYAYLQAKATDTGTGSEDGEIEFYTEKASTSTSTLMLKSGNVGIGQATPSSDNSSTTFLHIGSSSSDLSGLVLESDENKWEIRESGHLYFLDGTANHLLIKNNGNVGIGSGDPDKLLHLAGSATAVIRLENTGTALGDGDVLGTIEFEGQDASSSASGVRASISGVTQNASGGAYLAFSTANSTSSNAEAMRIIADGKVGVGTHEPDVPLTVKDEMASNAVAKFWNDGDNTNRYGIVVKCGEDSESGTNQHLIAQDGNGDITGVLKSVGGTFQLADSSDIRLKENIKDTTIEGIETVNKIKVRDFDWKKNDNTVIGGFIANELQEVYPQAVDGEPDAVDNDGSIKAMTVSRDVLVPLLVKAVQELSAKVEALENA